MFQGYLLSFAYGSLAEALFDRQLGFREAVPEDFNENTLSSFGEQGDSFAHFVR